ncbi:MAG: hypothetical protein IJR82_03740 [Bacilli bacterium]|nr:hypothetical protein [Bacilli bacterium]
MKKIIKIGRIITVILLIYYLIVMLFNQMIITDYNKQIYKNSLLVDLLYILTFNSSYVVYYNHGNLLYNQNDYISAIEKYDKALKRFPPQNRVCDIRINKVLSMLAIIDENNKEQALERLREARYILYENDCVDPYYLDSYSLEAERLEQEIKALEEQLQQQEEQKKDNPNNGDSDSNDEDKYEQIEEQLRQNEKEANRNRQEELEKLDNIGNYNYNDHYDKNW